MGWFGNGIMTLNLLLIYSTNGKIVCVKTAVSLLFGDCFVLITTKLANADIPIKPMPILPVRACR